MIEKVDDCADPRVFDYLDVRDRDLVGRKGAFMAEGRLIVRTLLTASRFRVRSILVNEAALSSMRDLVDARERAELPVFVASQTVMDQIAGFHIHRGCLAVGERESTPLCASELLRAQPERSLVVGLEGVANHDNLGAIFRNAAAFGASAVVLDATSGDPLYRKAIRVSMGAALRVRFARLARGVGLVPTFREAGFATVALTPSEDAKDIAEVVDGLAERRAILVGAEEPGLTREAMALADVRARIPIAKAVDSLNVATACGVAMHRLGHQLSHPVATSDSNVSRKLQ